GRPWVCPTPPPLCRPLPRCEGPRRECARVRAHRSSSNPAVRPSAGPLPSGTRKGLRGRNGCPREGDGMVQVRVEVRLKKGVTDPEGDNVQKALTLLGFKGLRAVHSSKLFLIDLATKDPKAAQKQ